MFECKQSKAAKKGEVGLFSFKKVGEKGRKEREEEEEREGALMRSFSGLDESAFQSVKASTLL